MINTIIDYIPQIWKAVTAAVTAFIAEYALAEQAGDVTTGHWIYLILTSLAIGAGVWAKQNQPAPGPVE